MTRAEREERTLLETRRTETREEREKRIRRELIRGYWNSYNNGDPIGASQRLGNALEEWISKLTTPSSVFTWLCDQVRANGEISFVSSDPSDIIYAGSFHLLGESGGNLPEEMVPFVLRWSTGPAAYLSNLIIRKLQEYTPADIMFEPVNQPARKRFGYILKTKRPGAQVFRTAKP